MIRSRGTFISGGTNPFGAEPMTITPPLSRYPSPTGPRLTTGRVRPGFEDLEPRRLLANQFVGDTFPWQGADIAAHPNGYWASAIGTLRLHDPTGAPASDAIFVHPGSVGTEGADDVASDDGGNCVVAWIADMQYDRPAFRLFDATGKPRTGALPANTSGYTTDDKAIDVDMLGDGRFILAWGSSINNTTVFARAFDADGQSTSPVVTVGHGDLPEVVALPGGQFAVLWQERDSPSGYGFTLKLRRFDAAGNPLGDATPVVEPPAVGYGDAADAADADASGRMIVTWIRTATQTEPASIMTRSYGSDGAPLGPASFVTRAIDPMDYPQAVSLDQAGRAVVVWTGPDHVTVARQMTFDGKPLGAEFMPSRYSQWGQNFPTVLARPDSFVISWEGLGPDPQSAGQTIRGWWGQRFDNGGSAVGQAVTSASFDVEGTRFNAHTATVKFASPLGGNPTNADATLINLSSGQVVSPKQYDVAASFDRTSATLSAPRFLPLPDGDYRMVLNRLAFGDALGNPMPQDFTFDFYVLAGDANRDRKVDFNDLAALAQNYNTSGKSFSQGNFSYDSTGKVDFNDLVILAQRYNTSLPPAAARPVAATLPESLATASLRSTKPVFNLDVPVRRPKPVKPAAKRT
jgi:hypothetical protein